MARTKKSLDLTKLTDASSLELEAMVAELFGEKSQAKTGAVKLAPWSRRFAASGKGKCGFAPKIRPA